MIHFKGIGEHSVFELEKIIIEQQEQLHKKQIEIQKITDWISVETKLPQEQIVVIGKTDKLREPCACYYETSSSDFRLYPHGGFVKITHWRLIY